MQIFPPMLHPKEFIFQKKIRDLLIPSPLYQPSLPFAIWKQNTECPLCANCILQHMAQQTFISVLQSAKTDTEMLNIPLKSDSK